ncbi:MAG: dethiobiotin synthase [Verrucomicrobiota bacterium]|nr:dethiobiotin synthase [Verrucomicrobiota bacterium]
MSLFVTGTDTGVGKTFTAMSILRLGRAAGMTCAGFKPICCGDRSDAELLLAASSPGLTLDELNPIWLRTPAAPFSAALIEGVTVETAVVVKQLEALRGRFDLVVMEGAGGWLVPIRRDYFMSDLAREMGLPVLVVALNRLGCLNHTLLTLESVRHSGLRCAGMVLNSIDALADVAATTNRAVLSQLTEVPILTELGAGIGEFPADWRSIVELENVEGLSAKRTQV